MDAFAELKEVRGVRTRSVSYVNNKGITQWGYELKNENPYDVWLDLELKTDGFSFVYNEHVRGGVHDTKSITLKSGETYVWKCGDRMMHGRPESDYHEKFYIIYKAYKAE